LSTSPSTRVDFAIITEMVQPHTRVLDIGCGNGDLLSVLQQTRNVDARGIELSRAGVQACVTRGLSVIQGDADTDLEEYPDKAFDYVILSQTLQATKHPDRVLKQLLRIGHRAIVSVPNFGHWRIRSQFVLRGRMPVTKHLPYTWYNTPNIHFCTIRDFVELCNEQGVHMERAVALNAAGKRVRMNAPWWVWNVLGQQAVFLLRNEN
jgi:methionine biosynthesis protein MetW